MSDTSVDAAVGKGAEWRIKSTVIDLYPIRLKDWPDASKLLYLLNFDSLADIAYMGLTDSLVTLLHIAARYDELESKDQFEVLQDMTDADYKWARNLLSAQNDIDMDRLMEKISKISGDRKNAVAPSSPSPMV